MRRLLLTASLVTVSCSPPPIRQLDAERDELQRRRATLPAPLADRGDGALGYHGATVRAEGAAHHLEMDLGAARPIDALALVPVGTAPGYGFPVRFRVTADGRTVADESAADCPNPGVYPYLVRTPGLTARRVRIDVTKNYLLQRQPPRWTFALAEIMVLSRGRNIALGRSITAPPGIRVPPTWAPENLVDGRSALGPPVGAEDSPSNGFHSIEAPSADRERWVQIDLGRSLPLDEIRLVPARPTDWVDTPGFGFPVRYRVQVADDPGMIDAVTIVDHTQADAPNPGDNTLSLAAGGQTGRHVRLTATKLAQRLTKPNDRIDYALSLAELQVYSAGRNVALGAAVSANSSVEDPRYRRWGKRFLVDGFSSTKRLVELPVWLDGLDQRRRIEVRMEAVAARRARAIELWIRGAGAAVVAALGAMGLFLRRQHTIARRQVERVRTQITRDLHDDVGSNLSGIALLSELVGKRAGGDPQLAADLVEIRRLARESTEAMRDIVWLQSRDASTVGDLAGHLRDVASVMLAGRTVEVRQRGATVMLPLPLRRQVLLLAKEALHNVHKHANAKHVELALSAEGNALTLRVRDDGRGFDPGAAPPGHGVEGMLARVSSLGGTLDLVSGPGQGTTLTFMIPLS